MNARTILAALVLVGSSLILSVLGIVALAVLEHPIPDVLQNIAVGSLTGLVGLLVTPSQPPRVGTSRGPADMRGR